jgi:hypothetical protein
MRLFRRSKVMLDSEMKAKRAAFEPNTTAVRQIHRFRFLYETEHARIEVAGCGFLSGRHRQLDVIQANDSTHTVLRVENGDPFRSTRTPRGAPRPLRASIPTEQRADRSDRPKQDSLNGRRYDEDRLRSAMPQQEMREIEQRRSIRWTCVDDFEDRLQEAIEIRVRPRVTIEPQQFITAVPPPVWKAVRKQHGLSLFEGQLPTADLRGQDARSDDPPFIFDVVNVQRRALAVRRQGAPELEHCFFVALLTPHIEHFTGVSVVQPQRRVIDGHGCLCLVIGVLMKAPIAMASMICAPDTLGQRLVRRHASRGHLADGS